MHIGLGELVRATLTTKSVVATSILFLLIFVSIFVQVLKKYLRRKMDKKGTLLDKVLKCFEKLSLGDGTEYKCNIGNCTKVLNGK